jgi:hypothetical protein
VKQVQQLGQGTFIDGSALLVHAVASALFQMLIASPSFGYPDNRQVQVTTLNHMVKRGKYLLVCQVSHRSEQNQSIGWPRVFRGISRRATMSEIGHQHLLVLREAEQS